MRSQPEIAVDTRAVLGEGPVWDERTNALWWVDILTGDIHRFEPATGVNTTTALGVEVGCIAKRRSGDLIITTGTGVEAFQHPTGTRELLVAIEPDDSRTRANDGKCDAAGRLYVGTMDRDAVEPIGALYRVDPDRTMHRLVAPATIANGLGWSPDGSVLYWIDSTERRVDAFDVDTDTGDLHNRRTAFDVEPPGLPDGMCVDADGCLWVAMFRGWGVRRYTPRGALDRTIRLPVAQATCCTFGGTKLTDLYITTAADELDRQDLALQPSAGALFCVGDVGTSGLPTGAFGG